VESEAKERSVVGAINGGESVAVAGPEAFNHRTVE
jgi:hypothetical protein